jgi:hypothetical protein
MKLKGRRVRIGRRTVAIGAAVVVAGPVSLLATSSASASAAGSANAGIPAVLQPGKLLVSTSTWQQDPNIIAGTTMLPPGCSTAVGAPNPCVTAQAGGSYPFVFNNDAIDSSFGVTQPIVLEQLNPSSGKVMGLLAVPNFSAPTNADQLVTSFSSKSELALNQSTDGNVVTFMGYVAPVAEVDVSNSNTPGAIDPTNSGGTTPYYRAVAELNRGGQFQFTETNAYSGNNGRAVILNSASDTLYASGNAGNGANPEPEGVVEGAGSQILAPSSLSESDQTPGAPTPMGNFNILQLPMYTTADKSAKDNNFRGLTVDGNVVYMTKGSGSNGIDTVYFLDTTGTACPTTPRGGGVGIPGSEASLPAVTTFTSPTFSTSDSALGLKKSNPGLTTTNMCVLHGFPTVLAKNATDASDYPFGIWFANPTTLYVADEGSGDHTFSEATDTYTAAAASTTAGLQKWVFDGTAWKLAYTIQNGLSLGTPESVANDAQGHSYPTGNNAYVDSHGTVQTGPWTPATDGLRNLTGRLNANGTVSLWATTSTVSWSGDQGADPNGLVAVTDNLSATTLPPGEAFSTVVAPTYGQVVRGVSFTPGTK